MQNTPSAPPKADGLTAWFLYLIECQNGHIYTGITTNVTRRYHAHLSGQGARYTRAHRPRQLLAVFPYPNRAAATQAEYRVKQLSAKEKRQLAATALPYSAETYE